MNKTTTKSLDGTKYELLNPWYMTDKEEKKVMPEQIIVPFHSLGIGTRLQLRKNIKDHAYGGIIVPDNAGSAVITETYEKNGKFIIKAVENTRKEDKLYYANKVIKEIDFTQGLANERFVEMLSNVFTEKQLKKLLKAKDIEILLFDGLMYLKLGNKAYRL